jgi:hypothetical protein
MASNISLLDNKFMKSASRRVTLFKPAEFAQNIINKNVRYG